jgi:O-antigen/teichoic acid export membrane protein
MKRNFAYTAVSVGSRLLVGLLLFLLLARLWGPELFGTFAFVFSVCALLTLLVDFGFALYLLREVSAAPEQAAWLVAASLRAKLALCGLLVLVAVVVALTLGPSLLPPLLFAVLLAATLAMSFADFFIAPLRALGRYDLETGVVTVSNGLMFLFAGGVAWLGGGLLAVAGAMVVSRLLFALAAWVTLRRLVPSVPWRTGGDGVRHMLRRIWPYGLDGMLTTAWSQIDVVAVRLLFGVQAAGLYAAGQKIVLGVSALAPIVGNVMIPRLSRQSATRAPGFWRTAAKTGLLMAVIGLFFAWPLIVLPERLALTLFGEAYAPLAALLPWFGGVLVIRYLGASFGLTLTAAGLQRRRLACQGVALLVFLALLVPVGWLPDDARAVVIALLISYGLLTALYAQQLWRHRLRTELG